MTSTSHFFPNYVVKSDYLPTRIVDGNNSQTAELVPFSLFSSGNTNNKKEEEESSLKDQLTSIPIDISPTKSTKRSELINH